MNNYTGSLADLVPLAIRLSGIRNRDELYKLIETGLSEMPGFDNLLISVGSLSDAAYSVFMFFAKETNGTVIPDFSLGIQNNDPFLGETLHNELPVTSLINDWVNKKSSSPYILYCNSRAAKQLVSIPIFKDGKNIGALFFGFKDSEVFSEDKITYVTEAAKLIAQAVCVVREIEAYEYALKTREYLLELSEGILLADNKFAFRNKVVPVIKQLIGINGLMILTGDLTKDINKPFFLYFDDENLIEDDNPQPDDAARNATSAEFIEQVLVSKQPLLWSMSDLMKSEQRPLFLTRYRVNNIKRVMACRLTNNDKTVGIAFFFSGDAGRLQYKDLLLTATITTQLAVGIAKLQANEQREVKDNSNSILLSFYKNAASVANRKELQHFLTNEFKKLDFINAACIFLPDTGQEKLVPLLIKQTNDGAFGKDGVHLNNTEIENGSPFFAALTSLRNSSEIELNNLAKVDRAPSFLQEWVKHKLNELMIIPFLNSGNFIGALFLFHNSAIRPEQSDALLNDIISQLKLVINNLTFTESRKELLGEINGFKRQLGIETNQEKNQTSDYHRYIVGNSSKMKDVFQLISKVAGTESSVLILGETGTGKELLAKAIHDASLRKGKPLIKVNCAALPGNLIESELFGHERGSFTGAIDRKIGKFEQANNGTIFLDEIGELPLNLQTKLLRALQEKEIERIGGKTTIKTDIRIIAATNRDLFKASQQGTFRSDLFFRLNVFPVTLPALRDRKEDIPLLVNHFAAKYGKRTGSAAKYFSSKAMKQLVAYNWPGNVRELEHLVQRSVILSKGKVIGQVFLSGGNDHYQDQPLLNADVKTIDEVEREHILSVLKMVNGKVSGVGGAAEMLKIPATTLSSKIIKLKIKKGFSDQGEDI